MDRFDTKTALVIGGSRGIGAAIVERLASEGARVAFTYTSSPAKAQELAAATRAIALQADSADRTALQHAVADAAGRLGGLDILVVNAGIMARGHIAELDLDLLDRALAVNVRGVVVAIHAAVPHLREHGRVITIGSNTAESVPVAGSSIYAMTKGAVATLVRGLARDLAPKRITVNNLQPGPTETDMNIDLPQWAREMVPVGRIASPAEIAGFAAYLASAEAGYVTGASLTIDGGFSL
jgi:3-oxoacyl-[acyl-carrier protein] reductase